MNTRLALNGLALAFGATVAASVLATTYRLPLSLKDTVELTAEERNQVAQLACIGPHNLQLVAAIGWVTERDRRDDLAASARCQSHRAVLGQPVVFEANCQLFEPISCDSQEVLLVRIDAEVFDIRVEHDVVTLERAFAMARYLKRAGALQALQPSEPMFPSGSGPLLYVRIVSSGNGQTRLYVGTKLFTLTGSDASDFQIESIQ